MLRRQMPTLCPTLRAPDAGESGMISGSFLPLIIFPIGRLSVDRPSAGTLKGTIPQTVGWFHCKNGET